MILQELKRWGEAARMAMAICTLLAAAATSSWTLFRPHLAPFVALPEMVAAQGETLDAMGRRLSSVEREIEQGRVPERIVDYDAVRTRVLGPCAAGAPCNVTIRARRTSFGAACGPPSEGQPYVVNHNGVRRPARFHDGFTPVEATTEWTTIDYAFIVPAGVQQGPAEYYVALIYDGCERRENSPAMPFHVVASQR